MDVPAVVLSQTEKDDVRRTLEDRPSWWTLAGRLGGAEAENIKLLGIAFALAGGGLVSEAGALERVPPGTWSVWSAAAAAFDDPIIVGRVEDLLYVRGDAPRHVHGRKAAAAMRLLAGLESWDGLERSDCLSRAIEILTELNDSAGQTAAVSEAVGLVEELLVSQPHPGPPLRLAETIVRLKPAQRPLGLDHLLDRAAARYERTHAGNSALALAEKAATSGERRAEVRERHVTALREEATGLEGLAKASALQRAIELARRYGMPEATAEIVLELQEVPLDPEEFEGFSSEISLPTETLEAEIERIAGSGADGTRDAIENVGLYGPLSGTIADIDRALDEEAEASPLRALFGSTVLGAGSAMPVFIANTPESKRRYDRAQRRALGVQFMVGALVADMLDAVERNHGRPAHDDLSACFTTDLVSAQRAGRFARALELFWDEAYDESAHVLVPRLEAVLRELVRQSGTAIWKPAGEGTYGGVISLNTVLARLRELSNDDPWFCTIEAILVDPLAMNLRNTIAHGLVDDVGRIEAAALLHIACFLSALERPAS